MPRFYLWHGAVVTALLLPPIAVSWSAPTASPTPKMRVFTASPGAKARPFWPWANQEWTRSDADFVRIRREVDAFIQSTASRPNRKDLVLAKLRELTQDVQSNPRDAQAQFHWAYATHEARKIDVSPTSNGQDIFGMYDAFESARPKGSYQYDRMIYILRSRISDFERTKPLGKRLLRRNPADADVEHFLTRVLSTGTPEEQALALRYAQELQRKTPQLPRTYRLLGFVYETRWDREHKAEDVDRAVASYRKYLSMIPPTFSSRHDIEHLVAVLEREKAQRSR